MNKHEIGTSSLLAMVAACLFGLACAAVGGPPGLFAAAWHGLTLVLALGRVVPVLGATALGPAALYGLAALAGFGGDDPEDVDPHASFRLAVVALGCAVVGVTSILVWFADRPRRDGAALS